MGIIAANLGPPRLRGIVARGDQGDYSIRGIAVMKMTSVGVFLALSSVLALAGCSSGPSESDVRTALSNELEKLNEDMAAMAGRRMADRIGKYELTSFELVGCEPAGEAYQCDIVYSMETPMMPFNDKAVTVRMRKSDRGWIMMGGAQGMVMGGLGG